METFIRKISIVKTHKGKNKKIEGECEKDWFVGLNVFTSNKYFEILLNLKIIFLNSPKAI